MVMEAHDKQQLDSKLASVSMRLPTPSAIAVRLIELARDPYAELKQLVELVRCDPALTSKLLRLANSPLYLGHGPVNTLFRALQMLGLDTAVTLALSFRLYDELQATNTDGFDITRYWKRSLLTAVATRELSVEHNEKLPETFFLGGLLRDIGLLALAMTLGERGRDLYKEDADPETLRERETQALGFDHVEAGVWLLREWRLPVYLATSMVGSHDQPLPRGKPEDEGKRMAVLVAVAAAMSNAWLAGRNVGRMHSGVSWIPLHSTRYNGVIQRIMTRLPWIESCFEVTLLNDNQRRIAEDNAQEMAIDRTLKLASENRDLVEKTRELEQRTEELSAKSLRDNMTGLFTREYFNETLTQAFAQASRDNNPLTVAFLDIDRFKTINDTYGHAAGDTVITGVAHRLLSAVRQSDVAARYGGEEFVILMPDQSPTASARAMQRLVRSIGALTFSMDDDQTARITVSIGIATYMPESHTFAEANALLDAADQAMYSAKHGGRDQVAIYAPEQPQ